MIANYLKIVLRQIARQKSFAFINILGLTMGLIGFILIFLYVRYELRYDKHHKNIDRIYMIVRDVYLDNNVYNFTPLPYPFKEAITAEFPEIDKATRLDETNRLLFRYKEKTFDEPVLVADSELFDIFTFDVIEGAKGNLLSDNASVVISKKIADKYFAGEQAVGKVFQINGKYDVTVTGVYKDLPANSTIKSDIILPTTFLKTLGRDITRWNSNAVNVFVMLYKEADVTSFIQKLKPRLAKEQPGDKPDELFLHPYSDLHLHNFHYKGGAIQAVYIFSIIGVLIISLAAINYVNLVTARSVRRAKEIGIRKSVGAEKSQVIFQFLSESILFTLISLNFAVLVVELLLPFVNPVIGKHLSIEYTNPLLMLGLVGIALFTGLLAGTYPALYLSNFSPATVLKNSGKLKSGNFKSALVIVQFSVSIALIITSIVLYRQFQHMVDMPVGFSKENVFYFKLEDESRAQFAALQAGLLEIPAVASVSAASHLPMEIFSNGSGYTWEGKDPNQDVLVTGTRVDESYLKTFNMELTTGRFFNAGENVLDTLNKILKVVVNERMIEIANFKEPIGKSINTNGWRLEIIGVIRNFNFIRMQNEEGPLLIFYGPDAAQFGFVKVTGNPIEVKSALEDRYSKLFPQYPPNFQLLDDRYQMYFGRESQQATIFGYFTFLAIIISCLGLYGLASFIAEQRRKEIGIRKALGANTLSLSFLLLKDFAKWIIIANVVAVPLAWYYSNLQLSRYVYRTDISLWIFVAAAVISIVIACVTVIVQVIKTAKQNPALVLKYE